MLSIYLRHLNPTNRFNKSEFWAKYRFIVRNCSDQKIIFSFIGKHTQVTYLFALKTWGTRHKSAIVTCKNFKQRLQYKIQQC